MVKWDINPLRQLYFDVVHKILNPRKERSIEANYLDITFIECLNTEVEINFPTMMVKHMVKHRQYVIIKRAKPHALPYELLLRLAIGPVFVRSDSVPV